MGNEFQIDLGVNLAGFKVSLTEAGLALQGLSQQGKNAMTALAEKLSAGAEQVRQALAQMSQAGASEELSNVRFGRAFGEAAEAARGAVEALSASTGRGADEIQNFMRSLLFTGQQLGLNKEEASGLSVELTKTALALADFSGASDAEAVGALEHALMGNTRALRQFGVALDEDAVKARMWQLGLNPDKVTEQQTATVRLALIQEKLGSVLGSTAQINQTYAGSTRNLKTQIEELRQAIGKHVIAVEGPYVNAMASAVKSLKEWIEIHPGAARGAVTLAEGFVALAGTAGSIGGAVSSIAGSFGSVAMGLQAMAAAGNVQAAGMLKGLGGALSSITPAVKLLGQAGLVAGAAFAGWTIGTALDQALGISKAIASSVRDEARAWADYRDELARAKDILNFTSQQKERYTKLLAAGATPFKAHIGAQSEMNALGVLEDLQLRGTLKDQAMLLQLREKLTPAIKAQTDAQTAGVSLDVKAGKARQELAKAEKEYHDAVQEGLLAGIKAREGEAAGEAAQLKFQTDDKLKMLRGYLDNEQTLLAAAEAKKAAIVKGDAKGSQGATLAQAEEELQKHRDAVAKTQEAISSTQAGYESSLADMRRKGLATLKSDLDERIRTETEAIRKERELLAQESSDLRRSIQEQNDARKKGGEEAQRFLDRLAQDDLRRKSASLADIKELERETLDALSKAKDEDQRRSIQKAADAEAKRIANDKATSDRLQADLVAAGQRANDARAKGGDWRKELEGVTEKQKEIVEWDQKRLDALIAVDGMTARIAEGAKKAADVEAQKLAAQDQEIGKAKYLEQIQLEQTKNEYDIAARLRAEANLPAKETALKTRTETAAPALTLADQAKEFIGPLQQGAAGAAMGIAQTITAAAAAMKDSVSQVNLSQQILGQIPAALDAVAGAQKGFGSNLEKFGVAILDKLGATKGLFEQQGGMLAGLTERVVKIELGGSGPDTAAMGF